MVSLYQSVWKKADDLKGCWEPGKQNPGEGNGNPFQYSCLENSMDRGAWWAWGHKESDTTDWLTFFLLYQSVWKKADDLKWCWERGNRTLLSVLVGMYTHQSLKDPLWLNWVKFRLQVSGVLQSTLVDIIRNIPLCHKEPFLADPHPSIAKSRRDASRSEKAVHGELCIDPK